MIATRNIERSAEASPVQGATGKPMGQRLPVTGKDKAIGSDPPPGLPPPKPIARDCITTVAAFYPKVFAVPLDDADE